MKLTSPLLCSFCLTLTSFALMGQSKVFTNDDNIALKGYDVVEYHNSYQAVRGSNEFTAEIDGVTYYFSTVANQTKFQKNPTAYLPTFGGFCAFAMAMHGQTVPTDPETFKIRDGKLYLFFNDYYEGKPFNTIVPWNGQEQELLSKATANWKKL